MYPRGIHADEGIRWRSAFAQRCVETRFTKDVKLTFQTVPTTTSTTRMLSLEARHLGWALLPIPRRSVREEAPGAGVIAKAKTEKAEADIGMKVGKDGLTRKEGVRGMRGIGVMTGARATVGMRGAKVNLAIKTIGGARGVGAGVLVDGTETGEGTGIIGEETMIGTGGDGMIETSATDTEKGIGRGGRAVTIVQAKGAPKLSCNTMHTPRDVIVAWQPTPGRAARDVMIAWQPAPARTPCH